MDTVSKHLVSDPSLDHEETTNFGKVETDKIETDKIEELPTGDFVDTIQD